MALSVVTEVENLIFCCTIRVVFAVPRAGEIITQLMTGLPDKECAKFSDTRGEVLKVLPIVRNFNKLSMLYLLFFMKMNTLKVK